MSGKKDWLEKGLDRSESESHLDFHMMSRNHSVRHNQMIQKMYLALVSLISPLSSPVEHC